tara:strand:+ start:865 stop:1932 length:1068 start_codon:yes stop_codon:yes gene_type:complete
MWKNYYFWVGIFFSIIFLSVIFFSFAGIKEIFINISKINIFYLFFASLIYLLSLWFRSERWKILILPLVGKFNRSLLSVVTVGYMANNLLPIRIGEVIRALYLNIRENISVSAAFGSIVIERLSDILILCFLLFGSVLFGFLLGDNFFVTIRDSIHINEFLIVFITFFPFLIILLLIVFNFYNKNFLQRIILLFTFFLPNKYRISIINVYNNFSQGIFVVTNPYIFIKVIITSFPVWICEILVALLIAESFDLASNFNSFWELVIAMVCFTAISNLAGIIPSTSGGWGPYDFFGILTLNAFGIDPIISATFAVTVHIVLWIPPTIIGIIILWIDKTSIFELIRRSKEISIFLRNK